MMPVTTEDTTPVLGGDGWVALSFRMADPLRQNSCQGGAGESRLAAARRGLEPRAHIGPHAKPTTKCSGPVYRARYYDPLRSRFVSEDPIGLTGGPNLYGYAFDAPLIARDPLGYLGIYGGYTVRGVVPGVGVQASAMMVSGTEGKRISALVGGTAGATAVAGGVSIGRGLEAGFFLSDVSGFLNSTAINLDTPLLGVTLYLDGDGQFVGFGLGGPSMGISLSAIGSQIPFSLQAGIWWDIISNSLTGSLTEKNACPANRSNGLWPGR